MAMAKTLALLATVASSYPHSAESQRTVASLNEGWKFQEVGSGGGGGGAQNCSDLTKTFPTDLSGKEVLGLTATKGAHDLAACAAACCAEATCEVYQFKGGGGAGGCWIGQLGGSSGPCPGTVIDLFSITPQRKCLPGPTCEFQESSMANRPGTAGCDGIESRFAAAAAAQRRRGGGVGGGNAAVEEEERARLVDRTDPVRSP